jgi:multisubunit Na+/H+ antiporter MnhB subunit
VARVDTTVAPHDVSQVERSRADVFMRGLLRVDGVAPTGRAAAERVFSTSILISATRCLLTYIVLPFLAPILGVAAGVGPVLGMVIGVVAIVFNIMSMRRFWRADHRWRWAYTIIATVIIGLLLVLLVRDVTELLS